MDQLNFDSPKAEKREQAGWTIAYCDGGSRGNPGPAGFGVYLQDEKGTVVGELSEFLGRKTNNYAEYSGLLAALEFALDAGHERLRVISDSELMVKQIKGQYRVNSPELRPLYEEAKRRIGRLKSFQIQHVLRDKNKQADRLANLAMDRGMGKPASAAAPAAEHRSERGSEQGPERGQGRASTGASAAGYQIPVVRLGSEGRSAAKPPVKAIRGFVKGGVVHLVEGELPDGVFVKIERE
ncbi:MAG TPA: ribonuclease HI family protein [Acidisarcina sp.]|nr:ribonuclease HI family protein [Acidisarcina sp.]